MPLIVDSFERLTPRGALEPSGLFRFEPVGTVYSRFSALTGSDGAAGGPFAVCARRSGGEQARSLMLLTYQTLTQEPQPAMEAVYDFLSGAFARDSENAAFEADDFDHRLGAPRLHRVARAVRPDKWGSVRPPRLFPRREGDSFWTNPVRNKRGVRVA